MNISIRRATTRDWEAIRQFIFVAYGKLARFKDYPRWNWQFVANPFRPSLADEVSVWIAEHGGHVIGQIAVQRTLIQIDGSEYPAGWIVDVVVLPAYRGRSLGHRLHAAVAREFPLLMTLTMAPATRRMALKAGGITLGGVHRYIKINRLSDSTVRRYLLARAARRPSLLPPVEFACTVFRLDWLVSRFVNLSRAINLNAVFRSQRSISAEHATLEIVEIESFDDEVDDFWTRVRQQYPAISVRNTRFLNWRYTNAPDLSYRRFVARRAGQCMGYIVVRIASAVELPAGIIVDLLTFRNDMEVSQHLIQHATDIFGSDVEFVDCATSAREIGTTLQSLGFVRCRTEHPTIVCRDPFLRRRIESLKEEWIFTKGDQDWDQISIS